MTNAVKKVIPLSIIYTIFAVLFTNYILLDKLKFTNALPDFILYIIYAVILYFTYGFSVSLYSSHRQCGKTKKTLATVQGLKAIILPIITYIIIYFIPQVRSPFNELFGDNRLGNSVAEIVLISLNLTLSTIINYFDSVKEGCQLSHKELEIKMRKLDKYLDKKPKKKTKKVIEIRD